MIQNKDISSPKSADGELPHINNGMPPSSLELKTRNSVRSGLQRMRVLVEAVHALSNQANKMVLYPNLAFHLLPRPAREAGQLTVRQFQPFHSPPVTVKEYRWWKELRWVYEEVKEGVLSHRRHKKEIIRDSTGEKKTLKQLSKLFQKVYINLPHIVASDLMELPNAARKAGFNGSFSLLESFFALRLRLRPLFIGIQGEETHHKIGENLETYLNIAYLDGGSGNVDQEIKVGLATVMKRLSAAAEPLRSRHLQHHFATVEVSPATRFLGALTWDVWEENDLALFIALLIEAEKAETYRLKRMASNQQGHILPLQTAVEQARKRLRPRGLTLVEWQKSLDPVSALREEIAYCTWLLESIKEKGLIAVIVPSLEGVGVSCSKMALNAFWDFLCQELSSTNGKGGATSLWTDDCQKSQGHIVEASWLLSQWGQSLDSVALAGLAQPLAPQPALHCFRKAVEKSNQAFYKRLQHEVAEFVKDLLLCQCTLHQSIDDLAKQIIALERNASQPTPLVTNPTEELCGSECESPTMLTNNRSTLHNRLRRLGVNQASIVSVNSGDVMFSSLSDQISDRGLTSVTAEAVSITSCLKELHTFWITETGQVTNLNPTKSSKGGGTWKVQFLNYISIASAKNVTSELRRFCQIQRQRAKFRQSPPY